MEIIRPILVIFVIIIAMNKSLLQQLTIFMRTVITKILIRPSVLVSFIILSYEITQMSMTSTKNNVFD